MKNSEIDDLEQMERLRKRSVFLINSSINKELLVVELKSMLSVQYVLLHKLLEDERFKYKTPTENVSLTTLSVCCKQNIIS